MVRLVSLVVGLVLSSATVMADFPKNNLHLLDGEAQSNITEEQFNQIIDKIINIWKPIAAKYGAELTASKNWNDSTVNAYAQQNGKQWMVAMFGGLARRPEVTLDGFAMVVCHELGHHFAGHYFYRNNYWAASEGESDYFATHVCARRIFANSTRTNSVYRTFVPDYVKSRCDKQWKGTSEQELCYRTSAAGFSLANLLATIGGGSTKVAFETPDQKVVGKTDVNHPQAQCRLDTYFYGALCSTPFDLNKIPAKDLGADANSKNGEMEAIKYSCSKAKGDDLGTRPLCWFHPQVTGADLHLAGNN